jgi:opacity protein-like surface antigen
MRLGILAWVFAALAIAPGAEARSVWIGPLISFPVPAGDVGSDQLGIGAGVTLNSMDTRYAGVGLDFVYHYWPASPEFKAAFDRYLRNWRFETIDDSTWAFSAFQMTAHARLAVPIGERHSPWIQVGGGVYRVNRNLAEPNWSGSPVTVTGADLITFVPGWYLSIGFDFRTNSRMVMGLNANYHRLGSENENVPGFTALTVGTHILFGW